MSSNYLNSADWTKQCISKIFQITHLRWIYWNILLHDKRQGYLHNKRSEEHFQEVGKLSKLAPNKVSTSSRFILEVNFTKLTNYCLKTQQYWMLAVKAALTVQNLEAARGARLKRTHKKYNTEIPSRKKLRVLAVEQQIRADGMHHDSNPANQIHGAHLNQTTLTSFITKHPHHHQRSMCSNPTSISSENRTSHAIRQNRCVRGYNLSFYWIFAQVPPSC
jgi:hypothetical protein